jgi:hypothetical protein
MAIPHHLAPEEALLQPQMGPTTTPIAEMCVPALTSRGLETAPHGAWMWLAVSRSSIRLLAVPTMAAEMSPARVVDEIPAMAQSRWAVSNACSETAH